MSTIVSKFIDDKKAITIDQDDWKLLNEKYDSDTIKKALIEEILIGNIRLPMADLSIEDARDSFINLCYYKCNDYKEGDTMTRYDYKYPISKRYIDETIVGNDASNYFQQYNRFCASGHGDPSPVTVWGSEKYLNSALKPLWTLKMDSINMGSFRTAIALRRYMASQFRPAMAKSIYEKFNSVDVLDFSSGWGDRLCGFYSAKNTKSYIGIDPNVAVFNNYPKQVELYRSIVGEKKVTLHNACAEDMKFDSNIVDTVFTSPPYFNAEMYTQDENQSYKKYTLIDAWLKGFMYKTLDNVWNALKPGGHLIVNISDVHRNGGVQQICDPMNDYIGEKLGGEWVECFGMKMSKRPNSGAIKEKEGVFIEPVWVWKKN